MSKITLIDILVEKLGKVYKLEKLDLGEDSHLHKKGMHFYPETYDIKGLGHVCVLKMKAMGGLMRMETLVISTVDKDAPLVNFDYVKAMGKETGIVELYNVELNEYNPEFLDAFNKIKEQDNDLDDYEASPNWYDEIRYDASYKKKGKKITARIETTYNKYLDEFLNQLDSLPVTDLIEKELKVAEFANKLFELGGPAVNMFKKLFGDDLAKKMVVNYMYGVK